MISGKVWGITQQLLAVPLIEVHLLQVKPGGFCSLHEHRFKWNAFFGIEGFLTVEVKKFYDPNDKTHFLIDQTLIGPRDFTTVAPGDIHDFHNYSTDKEAVVLEIYYPSILSADIVRHTVGGLSEK